MITESPAQDASKYAAETRLLLDLELLDRLHAPPPPPPIERLEAILGRKRLSQVLLLIALWPEEEDLLAAAHATQAA
jgi:hypothetical protein